MLTHFEVENYKGFKEKLIFDLSNTRNYSFNNHMVKNNVSWNSLVLGKNSSGKTILCTAIMDITAHLLDVQKDKITGVIYHNSENDCDTAKFKYVFKFGEDKVEYYYEKKTLTELVYEKIILNDEMVIVHDYLNAHNNIIRLAGYENLKVEGLQNTLSIIKYAYNNTIENKNSIIYKLVNFARGMLMFKCDKSGYEFIGYKSGPDQIYNAIALNNKIQDFEDFLAKHGVKYKLIRIMGADGAYSVGADFGNNKIISLPVISSSGTSIMALYYFWKMSFDKLSFLIIDEFDVFYHYDLANEILEDIYSYRNIQTIITTHNITLMNNKTTRPDCCYLMFDNKNIDKVCDLHNEEIRQGNSLERIYRRGGFTIENESEKQL